MSAFFFIQSFIQRKREPIWVPLKSHHRIYLIVSISIISVSLSTYSIETRLPTSKVT